MVRLTPEFNNVTVKKGSEFEIQLQGGGYAGITWESIEVTAGKASFIGKSQEQMGSAYYLRHKFKAEQYGDIEITAKNNRGRTQVFKLKVAAWHD